MTIGPEHELPLPGGSGDSDAVTVAFADAGTGLYGLARTGVTGDERTGMGIVFANTEPVAVRNEGVTIDVVRPLEKWKAGFDDVFDLKLEALSTPAEAALGGMESYEQLVRVRGTVAGREVDCLGQRGHSWGKADWKKLALARTVSAWFDDGTAALLTAVRTTSDKHHADEEVVAHVDRRRRARHRRRPAPEHDVRQRRPAGPRRARAVGAARRGRVPVPRRRHGAVRLDARPRRTAPRHVVLRVDDGGPEGDRPLRHRASRVIRAIISDFGGVLTTPLFGGFAKVMEARGLPFEALGHAMMRATEEHGENPLFDFERGKMTEAEFFALLGDGLRAEVGRDVPLQDFAEHYFSHLSPNHELIDHLRRSTTSAACASRCSRTTSASGSRGGARCSPTACSS